MTGPEPQPPTGSPAALVTLGRMPVSLSIARALHAAGHRVLVADPFRWCLAATSTAVAEHRRVRAPAANPAGFHSDLRRIIDAENVRVLAPSSEETMHVGAIAPDLPAEVSYFGVDQDRLLALHDKENFIRLCRDFGLDAPDTAALGSPEAEALVRDGPVIVKPVFGCSGLGLSRHPKGDALPESAAKAIVQRFIPGRVICALTLAHEGRSLGTVVYEPRLLSGTVAVAFERLVGSTETAARDWSERFAAAVGHTGFIAFDLIENSAGDLFGIECNPRATSGVHYFDPGGLGRAIADPASTERAPLTGPLLRQQFFPCLTETQARMFRPGFKQAWSTLRRAHDVTWDARDPWPLILMTFSSYEILMRTILKGESFGEAATQDIAWRS